MWTVENYLSLQIIIYEVPILIFEQKMMRIKILGCGNLVISDDGFGIHVIRELEKLNLPENVELIDAGTGGLSILSMIEDADKAIIIDALMGGEVGRVHRLTDEDLPRAKDIISIHDLGLIETLDIGRKLGILPMIVFICVGIEKLEFGMELSPKVKLAIPRTIEIVLDEISS
jgi:hydrogenase maturation protease